MLSIVITTYNNKAQAAACLGSVFDQHADSMDVVVVDNGSCDGTCAMIKKAFPRVNLIETNNNNGPCKARNQGIGASCGEWVLTLDSDVVLEAGFIRDFLVAQAGLAPDVGMVQSNILSMDGMRVYSQGIHLSFIRRFFDLNRGVPKGLARPDVKKMIGPCAAAAFYRRSMLEELKEVTGYFDERFFFLVEDVDLAWRAHKLGWKTVFMAALECRHAGDGSKTNRHLRQFLCWRNRHLMIRKNDAFWPRIGVSIAAFPYEMLRLAYLMLFNKYIWCGRL